MEQKREERTRVLVIGGWGRCGSTLLDMMLGQIDGFFSAGELRELWLRGCVENRPCGCGAPFQQCALWSQVGVEAFGGWDRLDLDMVMRVRYRLDRAWGLPRLAVSRHGGPAGNDLDRYVAVLERLLTAIAEVSAAKVVIDSSKLPTHTLLLARADRLDLRMVHLVRDSRGVAFSNRKHVVKSVTSGEPTQLPRYGSLASATRYNVYNGANTLLVGRRVTAMRLRYEDLVEDPERRLLQVARHATDGEEPDVSFVSGGHAVLAPNHLVDGNPVRFAQGPLRLTIDDAWRRDLGARERRAMTALTYPLLRSYGYAERRG
jgi:hypothetical protein